MVEKIRILVLVIVTFCQMTIVKAQNFENDPIYLTGELYFGNYTGVEADINYIFKDGYTLKFGGAAFFRKAKSLPDDFYHGLFEGWTTLFIKPSDQLWDAHLMGGKVFVLNKKGTIRVNLSAGIGFTQIREPANWVSVNSAYGLANNYDYNFPVYERTSLIINPKIEFPFIKYYGITLSAFLVKNKDRTFWGVGLGNMLGQLR